MKTKTLPVILMLVAGAIACILGFVYHYETTDFFTMVLIVLVVFYMLGCIVQGIIDKNFSDFGKEDENGVLQTIGWSCDVDHAIEL